jgi:hypothetical protein
MEQLIRDYLQIVELYYGTYLDGITAFAALLQEADDAEQQMRSLRPDLPPDSFAGAAFNYSKGAPRQPDSVHLHVCTLGEYKERNRPGGRNHKALGQMFVVTIYGYWEDHYRGALAATLGQSNKNAILSDLMGDIGCLRNAIVHHRGIGTNMLSKCKVFQWFKEGDVISFTPEQMEVMVSRLKGGLPDELRQLAATLKP